MNEHESKVWVTFIWAMAIVICTIAVCSNINWTLCTRAAIAAGLEQSQKTSGGYWVKRGD